MSREIKFRAWYKRNNHLIQDWVSSDLFEVCGFGDEDYAIEQYTGLKDKGGREIYEGDILRLETDGEISIHAVRWYGDGGYPAFDLDPTIDVDSNCLSYCMAALGQELEVIGNIHENPELLS